MFSIAAASYLSLYPSMLVFPVILLLTREVDESLVKQVLTTARFGISSHNMVCFL